MNLLELLDQPGWVWWRGTVLSPPAAAYIARVDDEVLLAHLAFHLRVATERTMLGLPPLRWR